MNTEKHKVPVVLFAFNRPDHLAETLKCLKYNNIDLLYVFVDGPRNSDDSDGVSKVKHLVNSIDWVKVNKFYSKSNKGLSESIIFGLNKVFVDHESAIVIEDDICVAPNFYKYMIEVLQKYKTDNKIAGVTGLQYPIDSSLIKNLNNDVFLSSRFASWGWGTWRKEWNEVIFDRDDLLKKIAKNPDVKLDVAGKDNIISFNEYKAGRLKGCWDVLFNINMMLDNKYFVWPKYNLVNNLGLNSGIHGSNEKSTLRLMWAEGINEKIPIKLSVNKEIINQHAEYFTKLQEAKEFGTLDRFIMKTGLIKLKLLLMNIIKKILVGSMKLYYKKTPRIDGEINLFLDMVSKRIAEKGLNYEIVIKPPHFFISSDLGYKVLVNQKFNSVSNLLLSSGYYEDVELNLFKKNLHSDSVVFDVGANVGIYSILAAKVSTNVKVYAFEPVPDTVSELQMNLANNDIKGKILIQQIALSNKAGKTFITDNYHSSNYITSKDSKERKIEINVDTLDNFVKKNKIEKIDMIKIDVEGFEPEVLLGGERSIKKFKPKILLEIFEKNVHFNDRKFVDYKKVTKYLSDIGYKYVVIGDNGEVIESSKLKNVKFNKPGHNYLFYVGKLDI